MVDFFLSRLETLGSFSWPVGVSIVSPNPLGVLAYVGTLGALLGAGQDRGLALERLRRGGVGGPLGDGGGDRTGQLLYTG